MTREEIIERGYGKFPQDIIEIINDDGSIMREDVNFELRKAYMEGLIDNNMPLPSNVDEAADAYANKEFPDEASCGQWGTGDYEPPVDMEYPREIAKDAFKSGAEWMAQQGQTFESVVRKDSDDELYVEADVDENKFKMADNVIIQVRKKQ